MRHINNGDAKPVMQMFDFKLHMFAQLFVKRPQGFIHQDQIGFKYQGTRQGNPLLLSARKLCGAAIAKGAHLHHVQRFFNVGFSL